VKYQHEFLKRVDQYYKNVPNTKDDKDTKNGEKV